MFGFAVGRGKNNIFFFLDKNAPNDSINYNTATAYEIFKSYITLNNYSIPFRQE